MTTTKLLPAGFEDLEPFGEWILNTEGERATKRVVTPIEELDRFYNAMLPRTAAALDHLDRFDVDALPEAEARLLNLTLALAEVGNSVEVYRQSHSQYAMLPSQYAPQQ